MDSIQPQVLEPQLPLRALVCEHRGAPLSQACPAITRAVKRAMLPACSASVVECVNCTVAVACTACSVRVLTATGEVVSPASSR